MPSRSVSLGRIRAIPSMEREHEEPIVTMFALYSASSTPRLVTRAQFQCSERLI